MKPANQSKDKSPFGPGSCKCGVPNCAGHQVGSDGKVRITNHPSGKNYVLDVKKRIAN